MLKININHETKPEIKTLKRYAETQLGRNKFAEIKINSRIAANFQVNPKVYE